MTISVRGHSPAHQRQVRPRGRHQDPGERAVQRERAEQGETELDHGIIEKSAGNNKYPGPGTPAGAGAQLGPNSFRHSARFLTGLAGAGRALHWAAHVLISHCNYLRAATTLHSPSRDPTPGEIKGWPHISYLLSHRQSLFNFPESP